VRIPGGLAELASGEIPRPLADAIVRVFGIRDVFTIGITDGEHVLGNLHVLTTHSSSTELPTHVIESFVRHCFSTLAGIRKARDLAESAAHNALLIESMIEGIALHEIILDDDGEPCDYRFLDVNHAFEDMTGLKAKDIIGRTALEVLPGIERSWIERYGVVATTGVAARFEDYSGELGKYFGVAAYSPQPGQFVTVVSDVTERKEEDAALAHFHDLMRYVIEHDRSAVAVHDRDMKYIYVSQRYLDDYGVSESNVIGRHHYDVFPDLPQKWKDVHQKALAGEISSAEDDPYVREDGTVDWTRWECRPWYQADGSIGGIIVYTEVITERKRMEEALRESEAQLKKAQHFARLGSWTWDIKTNELEWSDEMFVLFGIDKGTFTGDLADVVAAAIHPDDREKVEASNRSVMEESRPVPLEYRVVRPDGSTLIVWAEAGELVLDEAGAPALLSGTVQDITERKRVETELERQIGLFQTAIANLPVGIFMVEAPSGRPLIANERAKSILGRGVLPDADEDTLTQVYRAFRAGTDEPYPPEEMPITQGMRGRSLRIDDMEVERPDGTRVLLEIFGTPVNDVNGSPWASLVGFIDITERKRAEDEIQRLNEELELRVQERTEELTVANEELVQSNTRLDEATRAKSDFLASMSHELRTPLNSIIGFSDILMRGMAGELGPEQDKQIRMINTSGKYLLELINEVLDLSAIEAGQLRIERGTVDASRLVAAVVESLAPLAADKGLELIREVAPEVTTLVSDHIRLEQVLFNLVGNAIKFTDSGAVRVEARRVADDVVFTVADTGRGISEDDLARIFDEFYQVERHDVAKSEGTGLGLTVSRRLVELLGGTIAAESVMGEGSTFTVRLPVEP